ncbi:hypothetical protein [Salibacterium qingdaonense]|uniref:Uncharacterized protein n=1 Tax=Salibacterium qingdaonense TaxID=266892 RepID=A0A1I4Q5W5_9BACI|nr:hypothetical protein [Salibacterium qingdaonense]SFM35471.1 hypothetical protein SAMN04488054_13719 [Salibacterium qingdaonense]
MGVNTNVGKLIDTHIKQLEERRDFIYTIEAPEGHRAEGNKINALDELEYLREIEEIYSSVEENGGVKEGEVYNLYAGYLEKVKSYIPIIGAEVERVEAENNADLENIEILLKKLKQKREKLPS